ncbi:MAG: efflux RND transporter periplasmic adaptor subunit [Candidatus Sumerlaeia bacterium]|nr:efflux RND transporter periplasmic adaptor subunit [Candidatus Sumerlaeia bacterium]
MNQRAVMLLAGACALTLLGGCKPPEGMRQGRGSKGEDVRAPRVFLAPAMVQTVRRSDIEEVVATTGSIVPARSRMLRAEEGGRLLFTKDWHEADLVEKGELIATIESESLEGEIKRAEADIELARKTLDIGRRSMESSIREFRTLQGLYARGVAAQREVDSSEISMERAINQHKQNEINLEKALASLAQLRSREERLEIRSPFKGLIVNSSTLSGTGTFTSTFGRESITDQNNRLIPGEFQVCGVIDPATVFLRCDVTSKDIERVRVGQPVKASIFATEDFTAEGTVAVIAGAMSADTRAFTVDIELDNRDGRLRPGMFGRAEVVVDRRRDTVSIPKSIISRRNNRSVVFVAARQSDATYDVAEEREVVLGLEGRDEVEVTFGLREGDRLVVRGFEVLQDRTPLSVLDLDAATTGTLEVEQVAEDPVASGG